MRRQEEQARAAIFHFLNAIPLWGLVICAGAWFFHRDKSRYLAAQTRHAAIFHGLFLLALLLCLVVELLTLILRYLFPPVGWLLHMFNLTVILALFIGFVAICVWAGLRSWSGESFRYPFVGNFGDLGGI
jgi:uncharacterized Tic20 family protein